MLIHRLQKRRWRQFLDHTGQPWDPRYRFIKEEDLVNSGRLCFSYPLTLVYPWAGKSLVSLLILSGDHSSSEGWDSLLTDKRYRCVRRGGRGYPTQQGVPTTDSPTPTTLRPQEDTTRRSGKKPNTRRGVPVSSPGHWVQICGVRERVSLSRSYLYITSVLVSLFINITLTFLTPFV